MLPRFKNLVEDQFDENSSILQKAGFTDSEDSVKSLMWLRKASGEADKSPSAKSPSWYPVLDRVLQEAPMPTVVLRAVDKFTRRHRDPSAAFELFAQTPRSLDVIARLACGSSYLTGILLDHPDALRHLTTERRTAAMKSREDFTAEARSDCEPFESPHDRLMALRRYQRQEVLRIGMCDAFGLLDLKFVTLQLSLLADAMVRSCLQYACDELGFGEPPFAVIALGKLGGEELNYSSDIDLILVGDASKNAARMARSLIAGLSEKMAVGFLYRVDMRLRPWGDAGPLITSVANFESYLQDSAAAWEKQALLKARVIAGNEDTGGDFLSVLPAAVFQSSRDDVLKSIRHMKQQIESRLQKSGKLNSEVKLGVGSIRDIEFGVQALQLIHGRSQPDVASTNTLDALVRLADFGFIDGSDYRIFREGYIFFRSIEHALQLLHNQQTHELPSNEDQRTWLARRLDFPSSEVLLKRFHEHRGAVRACFERLVYGETLTNNGVAPSEQASQHHNTGHVVTGAVQEVLGRIRNDDSVHVIALSENQSEVCIVAGVAGGVGLVSMTCALLYRHGLDIRGGEAMHGPDRTEAGNDVEEGQFLAILHCRPIQSHQLQQPETLQISILTDMDRLLSMQRDGNDTAVRAELLEMFCRTSANVAPTFGIEDLQVSVQVPEDGSPNIMTIKAQNAFGFLFEVSNALSICGFRIRRAQLAEVDGQIQDVLHVTESNGRPVQKPQRLDELKTAVTLIKRFTEWLPNTNDQVNAILRFRDLLKLLLQEAQWEARADALSSPTVLRTVAHVLGMSRHLWEDFLRVRPTTLLPMLTDPNLLSNRVSKSDLQQQLNDVLLQKATPSDKTTALNEFKDHHLFRIDLRHVLGHSGAFGSFSSEVTELAEVVVEAASRVTERQLAEKYGRPTLANGAACPFTLAALGKFGGIEMGYASDIELFLLFAEDCETDGAQKISAGAWFEKLVLGISEVIRSRHKGIFEIDLRLRPFGAAGSPAVSLSNFESYYRRAGGDAWFYERQALVKLRCVAGHEDFSKRVMQSCHNILYEGRAFDFDAMAAMREKQVRQLVRGGTINAKLSEGGLVDCEYAVQALQMVFGNRYKELRTPNTAEVIKHASAAGLISEDDRDDILAAYIFLRELIDCLRMAHGNAQDLTIPERSTQAYQILARRMESIHDSAIPLADLEQQFSTVTAFARRIRKLCEDATE